jgi:hypothetical protein
MALYGRYGFYFTINQCFMGDWVRGVVMFVRFCLQGFKMYQFVGAFPVNAECQMSNIDSACFVHLCEVKAGCCKKYRIAMACPL